MFLNRRLHLEAEYSSLCRSTRHPLEMYTGRCIGHPCLAGTVLHGRGRLSSHYSDHTRFPMHWIKAASNSRIAICHATCILISNNTSDIYFLDVRKSDTQATRCLSTSAQKRQRSARLGFRNGLARTDDDARYHISIMLRCIYG